MQRIGKKRKKPQRIDKALANRLSGWEIVSKHPIFNPVSRYVSVYEDKQVVASGRFHNRHKKDVRGNRTGWACVTANGAIFVNPKRLATPEEWAYVFAHCLLHLAFDHIRERERPSEWSAACDVWVTIFLDALKIGQTPEELRFDGSLHGGISEEQIYQKFIAEGIPPIAALLSCAGPGAPDTVPSASKPYYSAKHWHDWFGVGLTEAVCSAVNVAGGLEPYLGAGINDAKFSPAKRARRWLVSSFPLLGSLATAFELIEDRNLCQRIDIPIAAVNAQARQIYVNPGALETEQEARFVMAHEYLHVGLRHHLRRQGRDPYLWNVACDYVINGWLVEMGVGQMPESGALYDPELKGLSAEAIYDRIASDLRRMRKLQTMRGKCPLGDIMDKAPDEWWQRGEGSTLDDFYRRCMAQGLEFHHCHGRGMLPAELEEEIRAMTQPPIPWDVELARWFDQYFPPAQKRRTFARPSRRQASTADIPRPRYVPTEADAARTFGVVLDTSGSMSNKLLAKALGAIASYSLSRDVPLARVIHCDAAPYDQGYVPVEQIAHGAKVKGRGGTVLQPAIDLLERAPDFPEKGPILIITDGWCDSLRIRRDHAFLMPQGATLPFWPKGKIFRIED